MKSSTLVMNKSCSFCLFPHLPIILRFRVSSFLLCVIINSIHFREQRQRAVNFSKKLHVQTIMLHFYLLANICCVCFGGKLYESTRRDGGLVLISLYTANVISVIFNLPIHLVASHSRRRPCCDWSKQRSRDTPSSAEVTRALGQDGDWRRDRRSVPTRATDRKIQDGHL